MSGLELRDRTRKTAGRGAPEAGEPRCGIESARLHSHVPVNPARGEAQGRIYVRLRWSDTGPQTGVEAQKSQSDHPTTDRSFGSTVKRVSDRRPVIPTKINRDAEDLA